MAFSVKNVNDISSSIINKINKEEVKDKQIIDLELKMESLSKTLNVTKLYQSDFDYGTYRIKTSGKYVLMEDIIFNPNPSIWNSETYRLEGDDWMPTSEQISSGKYPVAPIGAYHMGFFAAITIESDDVILDLGGYTIEQHFAHYLQQRFFSTIELASTPFISGQGPSNFGIFNSYKRIMITNGTLGLSAHSSIHGNGPSQVIISNLTCVDYEQAAIGINGGEVIYVHDVNIERNSEDSFIRATYSQGKFIRPFLRRIITAGDPEININGTLLSGTNILEQLEIELDSVYNDILNLKQKPTSILFNNPDQLSQCDGSAYGIVFNTLGAAVGQFLQTSEHKDNKNIHIENVIITYLSSDCVEIPALCVENNSTVAQRGPVGDVIRFDLCTDEDGKYIPNVLSNSQMYVAKYASLIGITTQASQELHEEWINGIKTLDTIMTEQNICYMYGRDAMSHIMKGNIGIFLSGASKLKLINSCVKNISNRGASSLNGDYNGYEGNRTRGIAITACKDLVFNKLIIDNIYSTCADVIGIDFITECSNVTIKYEQISGLKPSKYIDAPLHKGKLYYIKGTEKVTNLVRV